MIFLIVVVIILVSVFVKYNNDKTILLHPDTIQEIIKSTNEQVNKNAQVVTEVQIMANKQAIIQAKLVANAQDLQAKADASARLLAAKQLSDQADASVQAIIIAKNQAYVASKAIAQAKTDADHIAAQIQAGIAAKAIEQAKSIQLANEQAAINLAQTTALAEQIAKTKADAQAKLIAANQEIADAITQAQILKARSDAQAAKFNGNYSLKGGRENQYCTNDNGDVFICNRSSVGQWETFTLNDLGNQTMSIRAYTGNYCSNVNGKIECNRSSVGPWEIFNYTKKSNVLSLQNQNKYCTDTGGQVTCNADVIGAWETFIFSPL